MLPLRFHCIPREITDLFLNVYSSRNRKKIDAPTNHDPPVRARALRAEFIDALNLALSLAFDCQNAYDLSLRVPRQLERHPLEMPHGARLWARLLAVRQNNALATPLTAQG